MTADNVPLEVAKEFYWLKSLLWLPLLPEKSTFKGF